MKTPRRATLSPKGARAEDLVGMLRNVETRAHGQYCTVRGDPSDLVRRPGALLQFQRVFVRKRRKWRVRLGLVPERCGGDVILKWKVSPAGAPAQRLDG